MSTWKVRQTTLERQHCTNNYLLLVLSNDLMIECTLLESDSLEPFAVFLVTVFDDVSSTDFILSFVLTSFDLSRFMIPLLSLSSFAATFLVVSILEVP